MNKSGLPDTGDTPKPIPAHRVMALLDTHDATRSQNPVSCMAAALREARLLVGRDAETGQVRHPENGMTWAGALVYLIHAEQLGSCFYELPDIPDRTNLLDNALTSFGAFSADDAQLLRRVRDRLAHDYTLKGGHGGPAFALHGSANEPVVERLASDAVAVGLPALGIRVEQLNLRVLLLADEGRLGCHYKGGIDAVDRRFWMALVGPDPP